MSVGCEATLLPNERSDVEGCGWLAGPAEAAASASLVVVVVSLSWLPFEPGWTVAWPGMVKKALFSFAGLTEEGEPIAEVPGLRP